MPHSQGAVITGMGCVCAAGNSPAATLDALEAGLRRVRSGTELGQYALPHPFFAVDAATGSACFAAGRRFSALDTLELACTAAADALRGAGLPESALVGMGVVAGTTAGSALHFLRDYAASRGEASPTAFAPPLPTCSGGVNGAGGVGGSGLHDYAEYRAANLSLALAQKLLPQGGQGPRLTLTNACTSGADALGLGLDLIRQGAECVLCGGADALSIVPHTGFARLMIYDEGLCRPFDRQRKGLNLGEGAAMLVLESEAHARKRGAPVLGRVLGYGAAADAHHFTAPHPEARGLTVAMHTALAEAGVTPADLAFINAHATSTPDNDRVEGRALLRLCAGAAGVPVWASKGSTGHTLGAAGALEAVFCVEALRRGRVPASWGFEQEDPDIGLSPTTATQPLRARRALSTSLGFGGGNAALVLEGGSL